MSEMINEIIETISVPEPVDKVTVPEKYKEDYKNFRNREQLFKDIIYLNSLNIILGPQGSGKTYLIKSIISKIKNEVNNVLWIKNDSDLKFAYYFMKLKQGVMLSIELLFLGQLGNKLDFKKAEKMASIDNFRFGKNIYKFDKIDHEKYDLIIIDDAATIDNYAYIREYSTLLRHLGIGIVFIGQTETIIPKFFRDLCSLYIFFSNPDNKILNAKIRRRIDYLIDHKNDFNTAVVYDVIKNTTTYIKADGEATISEKNEVHNISNKDDKKSQFDQIYQFVTH